MTETTIIVIPQPDNEGNSNAPYIRRVKDHFTYYQQLLDGACYDIVRLFALPNHRFVYAMVDDSGKLKGLNANNVLYDYIKTDLGFKPNYTLDGTVLLSVIDEFGETSDFMENEAEGILSGLLNAHIRVQGKPIEADEGYMFAISFPKPKN